MTKSRVQECFGNRLRVLRCFAGFTQEALAELVGISVTHLSNIERGIAAPSFSVIEEFCSVFGVRPVNLFHFPDFEERTEALPPLDHANPSDKALGFLKWMGIWRHDLRDDHIYWSDSLYRLLGFGVERADPTIDLTLSFVHEEDRQWALAAYDRARHGEEITDLRLRFYRRDGSPRRGALSSETLRDGEGNIVAIHGVIVDVTDWVATEDALLEDQRRLEARVRSRTSELDRTVERLEAEIAQRRAAECAIEALAGVRKMQTVARLSGAVAHEFNNLLVAILCYSDLLVKQLPSGEDRDRADTITREAERAVDITRRLLVIAGQTEGQRNMVDAHDLIAQAIARRATDNGVVFNHDLAASESLILGNPALISTALGNLVDNAVEATPPGGEILISTNLEDSETTVIDTIRTQLPPGTYLRIAVSDEGPGVATGVRSRLFEPFISTKSGVDHKGLGLATAHGIATSHEGALVAESSTNRGSAFSLILPLAETVDRETGHSTRSPTEREKNGCVLIIDDDHAVRRVMESMIESFGLEVISAANGKEGLNRFSRRESDIGLVVLDIAMPEIDGVEIFHAIRQCRPDIPILFASGHGPSTEVVELLRRSRVDFIHKPFRRHELLRKVREI